MTGFAEQIADALDILNYDGAVQDTLAELRRKWRPVKGVSLASFPGNQA